MINRSAGLRHSTWWHWQLRQFKWDFAIKQRSESHGHTCISRRSKKIAWSVALIECFALHLHSPALISLRTTQCFILKPLLPELASKFATFCNRCVDQECDHVRFRPHYSRLNAMSLFKEEQRSPPESCPQFSCNCARLFLLFRPRSRIDLEFFALIPLDWFVLRYQE